MATQSEIKAAIYFAPKSYSEKEKLKWAKKRVLMMDKIIARKRRSK